MHPVTSTIPRIDSVHQTNPQSNIRSRLLHLRVYAVATGQSQWVSAIGHILQRLDAGEQGVRP
jgi:hypothetical protein